MHTWWLLTRRGDTGENICDTQSNNRRKKTMRFPSNLVSQCSHCAGAYWGLNRRASVSMPPHCRMWGPGPPQSTLPESHKSEHVNTHDTSTWLTKLGLTVNVLRHQSIPSLPFPDLWVELEGGQMASAAIREGTCY